MRHLISSTPSRLFALAALLFLFMASAQVAVAQEEEPTYEEETAPAGADIVSVLRDAGGFNMLVSALERTGLDQALASEGPYTLFAPTDEAFAALPEGTLEGLSTEDLTNLLRGHVVTGMVASTDVAAMGTLATASGSELTAGEGTVGGSNIVQADIQATNGIIHAIDAVILGQ